MEVRFLTRNVELPDDVREYMEKKVCKIEKFFDKILDTQVALNYKRGMNVVEITSNVNGLIMRGEDYAPDLRKAFDRALKNIERQIKRHKDYLVDKVKMKKGQDFSFEVDLGLLQAEKDEVRKGIVKTKKFNAEVMTPKEATMQMDLLGHSFFLFRSDKTGEINAVYRRDEGGYGLLEPR
jgi:putative sigma-54 modulation protein